MAVTAGLKDCAPRYRWRNATKDCAMGKHPPVLLDYATAGRSKKFLPNLSAVALAGTYLWTASDEMRSIECLAPYRGGYRLHAQYYLDNLFAGLPGAQGKLEADIEALDVANGRLWICGSHSLTRRSQTKTSGDHVDPKIRKRPSRRLLGRILLSGDGGGVAGEGEALPFKGMGSLRAVLGAHAHIAPFMDLPSKENGLDIEGLTIFRGKVYIGLRGPVVDNIAIVAGFGITPGFAINEPPQALHFVDLGGLGVRDLARWNEEILILAGPVNGADGPFELLRWTPRRTAKIQKVDDVLRFPEGADHPEAICPLQRDGAEGLVVLYDTKRRDRISGTRYRADWIALPP
jgi:hypothetical protein